jgi:DNA end-binding protein Ku
VKERELGLAVRLIEQISAKEFEPDRYEDSVKARVRALIDKKIAGEEIIAAPVKVEGSNVINLVEALEASLRRQAPSRGGERPAERTRRPARKASASAAKRKVTRKAAK